MTDAGGPSNIWLLMHRMATSGSATPSRRSTSSRELQACLRQNGGPRSSSEGAGDCGGDVRLTGSGLGVVCLTTVSVA